MQKNRVYFSLYKKRAGKLSEYLLFYKILITKKNIKIILAFHIIPTLVQQCNDFQKLKKNTCNFEP